MTTVVDDPSIAEASSVQERSRLLHLARGEQWPCPECTTTTPSQEPSAEQQRIESLERKIRRLQDDITDLRSMLSNVALIAVAGQVGQPR